ncbi:MAG: hypothetical protein R3320_01395 [Nitriliruptorales bacterium]|nr:hypothetical protein [Nitriliruptorales bacterium]
MRNIADGAARALAVAGALAVVVSVFLPWSEAGTVALDLGAGDWEVGEQPSLALVLVGAVGIPAVAAFVSGAAWPRVVGALPVAGVVLWWLASGSEAALTGGVWTALGGAVALLLSAGAAPTRSRVRRTRPDAPRTHALT